LKKAGRVMWKVNTFKIIVLSVSVKDRGVGTHKQVLNVLIALLEICAQ
jgi:hypothetical protein